MAPAPTPEEVVAAKRYTLMNLVRIGAVISVILGIAVAQGAVDLPYALGVVLAVAGLLAFFFVPPLLVRRWKAGDRGEL
ncbi:hypothetical protein [uncultured Erythrobacter sp.]|nr:hypothetical protein [uncultured Erythrobacter sp.]